MFAPVAGLWIGCLEVYDPVMLPGMGAFAPFARSPLDSVVAQTGRSESIEVMSDTLPDKLKIKDSPF